MVLFLAVCLDRHIDPVIRVYDSPYKATAFCTDFMSEHAIDWANIKESHIEGWLYHAEYSCEGDYVYVIETTLNPGEEEEPTG